VQIRYTEDSRQDLREIEEFIGKDNQEAAQKVINHILKRVRTLRENPQIGRLGQNLRTRKLVLTQYPYIVHYYIGEGVIYILRVLHTSKKWE